MTNLVMAIKCVGSDADGYWGSKTPKDPLKTPKRLKMAQKWVKWVKVNFFSSEVLESCTEASLIAIRYW